MKTATWIKGKAHCPTCGQPEYEDLEAWLNSYHFSVWHMARGYLRRRLNRLFRKEAV